MDLELRGKVAVVTGASRGIGRAVVDALLAEGVHVIAGARRMSESRSADGLTAVDVDLSSADGPATLVDAAVQAHGGLDYLVNNVGAGRLHFEGFASISDQDWQESFDTNLMSAIRATRAALPHVISRRGAIVNISSLNGKTPAKEAPEYSAMKAALLNISRALALELAGQGVRVNAITPGPVMTDMQAGPGGIAEQVAAVTGGSIDEYLASVNAAVPLGRFAEAREIADAVLMLLSPRLAYVTGADLAVDGAVHEG
jgi:NAD(P)-dependent dehydrogenase (short-subunit alcohol dehydrogenase family)